MDMDISSVYNNLNTSGYTSQTTNNINKTLKSDMSNATKDELLDACKEFEAYFYEQVFKKMEEALVPKSDDSSSSNNILTDYFKGNLIQEYSKSAADQSENGLAQMLYEQMKRNYEL